MFQSVDVTDWARDLLATVDLALSPSYASAGYLATATGGTGSADFDALVAAKSVLAGKIAQQLAPVAGRQFRAGPDGGAAVAGAAAAGEPVGRLRHRRRGAGGLGGAGELRQLRCGRRWPPAGRQGAGQPGGPVRPPTLRQLAEKFTISAQAVVELLSATTNVLATGTELGLGTATWTIGEHDSLSTGMATLKRHRRRSSPTPSPTRPRCSGTAGPDHRRVQRAGAAGRHADTAADALDVDVVYLALANQDLTGLLTGTVYLRGEPVPITEQTSSLAGWPVR